MLEVARLTATELARLDEQGVMIGLDDFGTGYSSLALLRRFPVRFLKIDQTFVTGLDENRGDEAIVEAVLGLGRSLGLEVVAEGIETPGQLSQVARLGCRLGQGFHLARPQAAADISHRLRQQRHTVAPAAPAR
jgi:EAL domain-containing protein (putative c-di-GMP-specific phosphodiesterase class I)